MNEQLKRAQVLAQFGLTPPTRKNYRRRSKRKLAVKICLVIMILLAAAKLTLC